MSKSREAQGIVRSRQFVLNGLNLIYPSGMYLDQLFRTVLASDPVYQWGQFEKDVTYLVEKGYLEYVMDDFQTPFKRKVAKLTAAGR